MNKDSINDAAERMRVLTDMRTIISSLKSLLTQQQTLLESDDVNVFIQSVAQNQNKLKELEQLMQALHELEPSTGSAKMEEDITQSLKELQELETQTHALANQKLDAYRKNVRNVRVAKKGIRSYLHPYSDADGFYFDKKK